MTGDPPYRNPVPYQIPRAYLNPPAVNPMLHALVNVLASMFQQQPQQSNTIKPGPQIESGPAWAPNPVFAAGRQQMNPLAVQAILAALNPINRPQIPTVDYAADPTSVTGFRF